MPNNPYAPPSTPSPGDLMDGHGTYQSSKFLVTTKHVETPPLCTFTGQPVPEGQPPKKARLTYHGSWLAILILLALGLLPALIFIALCSKKITVDLYRSQATLTRERILKFAAIGLFVVAIAALYYGFSRAPENVSIILPVSSILALIALLIPVVFGKRILARKWKKGHFFISGVHPNILAKYPPLPETLVDPKKFAKQQKNSSKEQTRATTTV